MIQVGAIVVFFAGFVVLMMIVGMFAARQRQAAQAAWMQFSQEMGIPVTVNTYPMIQFHGPWQGTNISLVHSMWRGHKGQRHYRYEVAAQIPMNCGDLAVDREGFFDMVGKAFGGQDIQIGDAVFDPAFRIRGSNPEQARYVLGPAQRQALLRAVQSYPTIHIANGAVRISQQGIAQAQAVRGQLQAIVSIAQSFQQQQPSAWSQPGQFNPYG